MTNGQSSFYAATPHTQRTAAELELDESGDDNENIQWNWREDNRWEGHVKWVWLGYIMGYMWRNQDV